MNSLDTLGYCKRLEAVGVTREHAEVRAQVLAEVVSQVATKDDLAALEVRLMTWVELYVTQQAQELKVDLLKWYFAISIAQASLIGAVLRYLPN